tara:strand:+ start:131 stop:289 length:159 start_codon:yes stop_codon:yes gene_type:complete
MTNEKWLAPEPFRIVERAILFSAGWFLLIFYYYHSIIKLDRVEKLLALHPST